MKKFRAARDIPSSLLLVLRSDMYLVVYCSSLAVSTDVLGWLNKTNSGPKHLDDINIRVLFLCK